MRTRGARSLEAVSGPAKISTAYLHKLEAGRVGSPSPRVLQRLAEVLEIPYWSLMELAGYGQPADESGDDSPLHVRGTSRRAPSRGGSAPGGDPTNAELMRLLEALHAELADLREGQEGLARAVAGLGGSQR